MVGGAIKAISVALLVANVYVCEAEVSNSELSSLIQSLWNSDANRLSVGRDVVLNLQRNTYGSSTTDEAPSRLFTSVVTLTSKSTYRKFIALLDNYNLYTDTEDYSSQTEKSEQQVFVLSILGTNVWQLTREFLIRKGYVSSTSDLITKLHDMWFREYSRTNGVVGSSGFEHVFVGEIDRENSKLSGAHNWVSTYLAEQGGHVNYMGYIRYDAKNSLYNLKITRGSYTKFGNSMFIGTSPEFEMALYTVCYLTRPDDTCRFTLNNESLSVKTYLSYNSALATAYPLA